MSDGHSREIIGFLCRWLLLAGAGAAVAAVTWAGLVAAAEGPRRARAQLLLRDWVAAPGRDDGAGVYLRAYLDPPASRSGLDVALMIADGRPLGVVRTYNGSCGMLLDDPPAGTTRLLVRGAPYSAMAFQARRCRVLCVPRQRAVFLVDARMVLAARARGDEHWPGCLRAMQAAGQVALFHPGPWERFLHCRRALRAAGAAECILFDGSPADPTGTLLRVGRELGRQDRREGIEVVTADADLARQSAGRGFATHLICQEAAAVPPGLPLRRHASLANLKDSIAP
jgi:hypothetical protein